MSELKTFSLEQRTLVFDSDTDEQIMWIKGVVTLPIGSTIELRNPNLNATVVRVRLLCNLGDVLTPCIDVHIIRPVKA